MMTTTTTPTMTNKFTLKTPPLPEGWTAPTTAPELREDIIDFIKRGLADYSLGSNCVGVVKRKNKETGESHLMLTILWVRLYEKYIQARPSRMSAPLCMASFEFFVTKEVRETTEGRQLCHGFCSDEAWESHVDQRLHHEYLGAVRGCADLNARFYMLSATGIGVDELAMMKIVRRAPTLKPFRPAVLSEGDPSERASIGVNLGPETVEKLASLFPALPPTSAARQIIEGLFELGNLEARQFNPDIVRYWENQDLGGSPVRVNLFVERPVEWKLKETANSLRVQVAGLVRYAIHNLSDILPDARKRVI